MIHVVAAQEADIAAWRELARQVEPLFGAPMADDPGFVRAFGNAIAQGRALCVHSAEGMLLGGLLWSGPDPTYEIGWLAVDQAARHQGVGRALVEAFLAQVPAGQEVRVVTFCEQDPLGAPARAFYRALGFCPGEATQDRNGMLRQGYYLRADPSDQRGGSTA